MFFHSITIWRLPDTTPITLYFIEACKRARSPAAKPKLGFVVRSSQKGAITMGIRFMALPKEVDAVDKLVAVFNFIQPLEHILKPVIGWPW